MLLDAGGEGADPEGVVHEGAEAVAEGGEPLYWMCQEWDDRGDWSA